MSDIKTNTVNNVLSQQKYQSLDEAQKSDIRAIMRIAFDVKHYDPHHSISNISGTTLFRLKNKLNAMSEIALQLLDQLQAKNHSMYNTVVNDFGYL